MVKLNSSRGFLGSVGTAVLGSLCFGGAVVYTVVVGASLVPLPSEAPSGTELDTMSGLSALPQGPVGNLQITVSDRERAYVQNLTCTGDPEADPAACAEIADQGGPGDSGDPFAEVADDAVCTDTVYGPQEAHITGTWEGEEVDTSVTRVGSCEEARWQRLTPVTDPLD